MLILLVNHTITKNKYVNANILHIYIIKINRYSLLIFNYRIYIFIIIIKKKK